MTNGFGEMSAYDKMVSAEDRWAIAGYVRALQLSRQVPATELSSEDIAALDAPAGEETETEAVH